VGQAKRRGTLEQRIELAIQRNAAIQEQLNQLPEVDPQVVYAKKHGVQRLARIMAVAGVKEVDH
jgi:hypothetical protein